MANDLNTVHLIGRLVRNPMQKSLPNGDEMIEFSIAVHHFRKRGDEWIDEASFFDCEQFRGFERVLEYMEKGKQIAVSGTLRQDRWRNGDGAARTRVKIIVNSVQLLAGAPAEKHGQEPDAAARNTDIGDVIPF